MGYLAIVDYGVGNLKSVSNAFSYLGTDTRITAKTDELEGACGIILPGVGAFPDAAEKLRASCMGQAVLEQGTKKPVLGICLGMQLLLEWGDEVRRCNGLGAIKGSCQKIPTDLKLPHIGWNRLNVQRSSALFQGLEDGAYVYFVHSYAARNVPPEQVIGVTDYGLSVVAAVEHGNFFGCQFHPEKSGETGLAILQNFAQLCR